MSLPAFPTPAGAEGSEVERGCQRLRRINLTAFAAIGFRGAMFLSGLIYIPLTIHYLGPARFGLWVAMTSVMTLLAFADCGVGYGLMNQVAYATGHGEKDSIRKSISSTFFVLCAIAVLGCLLLAAVYPFIPWQSLFRTATPAEASEAARAVAVMIVSFLLTLPLTTVQRVQAAYQEGFETQAWEIAGVILSLCGLLIAIHLRAGLPILAVVFVTGPLLGLVLNWVTYFMIRRRSQMPALRLLDLQLIKRVIHDGAYFFIPQIAGVLIFSIDSLIILHYFGEAELGKYTLVAKLFQTIPALAGVWFAPLWPAYAESIARGDHAWVRRTLFRSTVLFGTACALIASIAALFARPIIHLWTGTEVAPSPWLLSGFALFSVIIVTTSAIATYLNGAHFLKVQALVSAVGGAACVVLKIALCKYWSVSGAIWGTDLGYLLVIIPAYCFILPRLLRRNGAQERVDASETGYARFALFAKHAVPCLAIAAFHRSKASAAAQHPPRILVTRIAGIGDFVLLTPFLRELRRNFPSSHITLVVGRNSIQLAKSCPHVDEVLSLDPGPRERIITQPRNVIPFLKYLWYVNDFAKQHFAGRIDVAIQPCWDADTEWATLLTVLSGAATRIGYSEKASRQKSFSNFGQDLLFTDVMPPGPEQHESERSLDVLRRLGGTVEDSSSEIWWQPEEELEADAFLAQQGLLRDRNLFAFGIGAGHGRRLWPFYAELIDLLSREFNFVPLLLAGRGEEGLIEVIRHSSPRAVPLTDMPLGSVAAVLSRCALFVGNDSGPMHIAAAAGLPVVEISCHPLGADPAHPNSPERFGPLARRRTILQPRPASENCRRSCIEDIAHCISLISPEDVAAAVAELLKLNLWQSR